MAKLDWVCPCGKTSDGRCPRCGQSNPYEVRVTGLWFVPTANGLGEWFEAVETVSTGEINYRKYVERDGSQYDDKGFEK